MATGTKKKVIYKEPDDYFPESVRKQLGLGEYDTDAEDIRKRPLVDEQTKKTLKKKKK